MTGDIIRRFRLEQGLTLRQLAEQAGVSERTAWNWKQQEKLRKATEKNLGRIAEELKK